MKTMKTKQLAVVMGLLIVLGVLLGAGTAFGQLSGAIYTSDVAGNTNSNIYEHKADVYLNGGPPPNAPCSAGGLPDGNYYFQVTNPSGNELYSTDAIGERKFKVENGVITEYLGATHVTIPGAGNCGGIAIQLIPYLDTTNNGGEYKAWATPVNKYKPGDSTSSFGFVHSDSKTDNFKVRENIIIPPGGLTRLEITGHKFYDTNTNGVWNKPPALPTEVPIAGWLVRLTYPDLSTPDPNDVITVDTYTSVNGEYSFVIFVDPTVIPAGGLPFTLTEYFPAPSWFNTTPTSGTVTYTVNGSTTLAGPEFGNVCLGAGGGLTLGFWSNKNGQKLFGADDLALMVSLNLRNDNGSAFDPASYTAFRTWLLSAHATNMAYMLSAQLAAMELNVNNGKVNGAALIFAPGATSANAIGFATVSAVMAEADAELGLHGSTLAGSPYRSYQEALKDALDNANNNKTFVQPIPCAFVTPYLVPPEFVQ
jgi:hypothetical protein